MRGKWLSIVAALAVAGVLLPVAQAKDFEGAGTVRAAGSGEIRARGRGTVTYHLHGAGRLAVRHRHVNKITAAGHGTRKVDGNTVIFLGYRGTVTVHGPKIEARFDGGRVVFRGTGRGRVWLKGHGKYWINGNGPHDYEGAKTLALGTPAGDPTEATDGAATADATPEATDDVDENADVTEAVEAVKKHPSYAEWAKAHPKAAAAIKKGVPWRVWAKAHPAAAAALRRQRHAIRKKLDLNKDGVVDPKEKRLGIKRRVDANQDGKIQPVEAKQAHKKRLIWKKHTDKNKDGRVDKKERAIDALRRRRRRP